LLNLMHWPGIKVNIRHLTISLEQCCLRQSGIQACNL